MLCQVSISGFPACYSADLNACDRLFEWYWRMRTLSLSLPFFSLSGCMNFHWHNAVCGGVGPSAKSISALQESQSCWQHDDVFTIYCSVKMQRTEVNLFGWKTAVFDIFKERIIAAIINKTILHAWHHHVLVNMLAFTLTHCCPWRLSHWVPVGAVIPEFISCVTWHTVDATKRYEVDSVDPRLTLNMNGCIVRFSPSLTTSLSSLTAVCSVEVLKLGWVSVLTQLRGSSPPNLKGVLCTNHRF